MKVWKPSRPFLPKLNHIFFQVSWPFLQCLSTAWTCINFFFDMYKLFSCTCDHWCPPPHLIKKKMMNQLLPPVKGYTAPTDTILSDTYDQYLFSVLPLSVMSFYTSLQMYDDIPLITIPCMNDLVNQNYVLLTTIQLCLICGSKFLSTYS